MATIVLVLLCNNVLWYNYKIELVCMVAILCLLIVYIICVCLYGYSFMHVIKDLITCLFVCLHYNGAY